MTTKQESSTEAIAKRFYELAREGKFEEILNELFSSDAESVEPEGSFMQSVKGLDQIREKGRAWNEMVEEMHGGSASEPIVANDYFACTMSMDVTVKNQGRIKMDEICVYEVRDGKIVKEQFFFH
jgi:ketosteroid isomerase-like protein